SPHRIPHVSGETPQLFFHRSGSATQRAAGALHTSAGNPGGAFFVWAQRALTTAASRCDLRVAGPALMACSFPDLRSTGQEVILCAGSPAARVWVAGLTPATALRRAALINCCCCGVSCLTDAFTFCSTSSSPSTGA